MAISVVIHVIFKQGRQIKPSSYPGGNSKFKIVTSDQCHLEVALSVIKDYLSTAQGLCCVHFFNYFLQEDQSSISGFWLLSTN